MSGRNTVLRADIGQIVKNITIGAALDFRINIVYNNTRYI